MTGVQTCALPISDQLVRVSPKAGASERRNPTKSCMGPKYMYKSVVGGLNVNQHTRSGATASDSVTHHVPKCTAIIATSELKATLDPATPRKPRGSAPVIYERYKLGCGGFLLYFPTLSTSKTSICTIAAAATLPLQSCRTGDVDNTGENLPEPRTAPCTAVSSPSFFLAYRSISRYYRPCGVFAASRW